MLRETYADIDFELDDIAVQELPQAVLMVTPEHYQIEYVINPHMEGNTGTVDQTKAVAQWKRLRQTYSEFGLRVEEVHGIKGLPDMVFCANQTLPGLDGQGDRHLILSNMASAVRETEVGHFGGFFANREYEVTTLDSGSRLEGCGDAIWHHAKRLLWCGHGFRSDPEAFEEVCNRLGVTGILVELRDESFYHLDTCLSVIDDATALWVPSAFSPESAEMIERVVPNLIEVSRYEAGSLLACNAHCPDGDTVVIQSGCEGTVAQIKQAGFKVLQVDTGEFLKAGGSVFCMKQMFWS
jgi:N-dimethylarginine dimethylaminohydrolase